MWFFSGSVILQWKRRHYRGLGCKKKWASLAQKFFVAYRNLISCWKRRVLVWIFRASKDLIIWKIPFGVEPCETKQSWVKKIGTVLPVNIGQWEGRCPGAYKLSCPTEYIPCAPSMLRLISDSGFLIVFDIPDQPTMWKYGRCARPWEIWQKLRWSLRRGPSEVQCARWISVILCLVAARPERANTASFAGTESVDSRRTKNYRILGTVSFVMQQSPSMRGPGGSYMVSSIERTLYDFNWWKSVQSHLKCAVASQFYTTYLWELYQGTAFQSYIAEERDPRFSYRR